MFVSRRRDRESPHLMWRVRLFAAGAFIALAGIYLDLRWLVNVALGILIVGFLIRFLPIDGEEGEEEMGEEVHDGDVEGLEDDEEGTRPAG